MRWEFQGPWLRSGASRHTEITDMRPVVVDTTITKGPEDIYVAAGCQSGFLHASTAFLLAAAMIEAVKHIAPNLTNGPILEVTDPKGGKHLFRAVTEIHAVGEAWTATGNGAVITGPHKAQGYTFRFIEDKLLKTLQTMIAEEVTPHGTQTREYQPTP